MLHDLKQKGSKPYIVLLVAGGILVAIMFLVAPPFHRADLPEIATNSISLAKPENTLPIATAIAVLSPTAAPPPAQQFSSTPQATATFIPPSYTATPVVEKDEPSVTPTATSTPSPLPSATATAMPTFTATAEPSITASPTVAPTWTPIVHVIERGDNPSVVAALYGVPLDALLAANDMTGYEILSIGQELLVPHPTLPPTVDGTPLPTPTFVLRTAQHIVVRGDTLLWIARYYGTTVDAILQVNGLNEADILSVGQELLIPLNMPTATPVPTATPTHTATPGPAYLAPALFSPPDGAEFQGTRRPIMLTWSAVGALREDEWYVLRLQYNDGEEDQIFSAWTKATSWRVPASVYPASMGDASHEFTWDVTVVRHGAVDSDGNQRSIAVSFISETRSFFWY